MRRKSGFVLLLATASFLTYAAEHLTAAEAAVAKKITSIEGITEYHLENGLKVLLFPDPSKATVTVNMTVFVGSRHEGYGEAGMAHLLEHMLFKGCPAVPNVPKALKERGGNYNGTTWLDRTNYYETLPAKDENLEFALKLEADRLVNSFVRREDLLSEMTVVRNEFESGENDPQRVLSQRMMSAAFDWHNYGRSTIGNRADIERVPIEKLQVFYRKYYQPDNAMVIVAGRFEPEKALKEIAASFGAIPKPTRELDNTYTEEPAQDGERIVLLRRVGKVPVVGVLYHVPAGAHPDFEPIDVLETILSPPPAGRLYKLLVETKKASEVSGALYALHDPGALKFFAEIASGNNPEKVLEEMLAAIESVGENGVTSAEVDRAKEKLLKQRELESNDTGRLAVGLSEWAALGDWRLYFLYRDRLEKVTVADVQRVAKEYLKKNNRTVGIYEPTEKAERVTIPATPDLAKLLGDYKGRAAVSAGEAFDPSPKNIEARTQRVTLPSGIKAALLPKKTRGEIVYLRLNLRYGDEKNLNGLAKAGEYLPSMLMRGTQKLSRQELQEQLDKLRSALGATGQVGEVTFSIRTKREQLPAMLELLRQVLREPTLPEAELSVLRQGELSNLAQALNDPQALAFHAVNRRLSPYPSGDPRFIPTVAEEIEMAKLVSREQIERLYKEYLSGTNGELSIVGDFSADETLPLVNKLLADWQPKQTVSRVKKSGDMKYDTKLEIINTPDKENAVYFSGMAFPMKDDNASYPALAIGNFIFGSGGLSSRLGDRVRQTEGLSYGIGSGLRASPLDLRTSFSIFAITNPVNVEKLKTAINEEFDRILKDGVTDQELEMAKKGYLQAQEVGRTDDARLAGKLAETLLAGRTLQFDADQEEQIKKLKREEVHQALVKFLSPSKMATVVAGDLEKK